MVCECVMFTYNCNYNLIVLNSDPVYKSIVRIHVNMV